MARYMHIKAGVAVNAVTVKDPSRFPEMTLIQSDTAQIGDLWNGSTFAAPPIDTAAVAEAARVAAIDETIDTDPLLLELKGLTVAAFNARFDALSTAEKMLVLRRIARITIRRVL